MRRRWAALLVTTVVTTGFISVHGPAHAAACTYPLTVLPVPAGATEGIVQASSGEDLFAGTSGNQAVRWRGTTMTGLGRLATADYSTAVADVNASGTVVGYGARHIETDEDGWLIYGWVPFRSVGDRLEELPVPAGAENVRAEVVLDNGDVYGVGEESLYRWPAAQPGVVQELTGLPEHSFVNLVGADDDGTLAITMEETAIGKTRGYLWRNGLTTILPVPAGADEVVLEAIRNGRVLGRGLVWSPHADKPALWERDGSVAYLDGNARFAFSMNASALITGVSGERDYTWQGTVRQQLIPRSAQAIRTVTDGGTLAGRGGPNADKPILMRCN